MSRQCTKAECERRCGKGGGGRQASTWQKGAGRCFWECENATSRPPPQSNLRSRCAGWGFGASVCGCGGSRVCSLGPWGLGVLWGAIGLGMLGVQRALKGTVDRRPFPHLYTKRVTAGCVWGFCCGRPLQIGRSRPARCPERGSPELMGGKWDSGARMWTKRASGSKYGANIHTCAWVRLCAPMPAIDVHVYTHVERMHMHM